jgi:hypothetical protein
VGLQAHHDEHLAVVDTDPKVLKKVRPWGRERLLARAAWKTSECIRFLAWNHGLRSTGRSVSLAFE